MGKVLIDKWIVSEHGIFCGTLRIAIFDFDTSYSEEFKNEVYAQMEHALNVKYVSGQHVFEKFGLSKVHMV